MEEKKAETTDGAKEIKKLVDVREYARKTEQRTLLVKLTEAEILDYGERLSAASRQRAGLEDEAKSKAKYYKSLIELEIGKIDKYARLIRDKEEDREVECEVLYNKPEKGKKTITRLDTQVVVGVFDMTETEKGDLLINPPSEADRILAELPVSQVNQNGVAAVGMKINLAYFNKSSNAIIKLAKVAQVGINGDGPLWKIGCDLNFKTNGYGDPCSGDPISNDDLEIKLFGLINKIISWFQNLSASDSDPKLKKIINNLITILPDPNWFEDLIKANAPKPKAPEKTEKQEKRAA